jgi:hypothetical protein
MRPTESQQLFTQAFTYPVSYEQVVEAVGDVELTAPSGDDETIGDSLARAGATEFESSDELYETTMAFLSDDYIGRKRYDDRGGTPAYDEPVSF